MDDTQEQQFQDQLQDQLFEDYGYSIVGNAVAFERNRDLYGEDSAFKVFDDAQEIFDALKFFRKVDRMEHYDLFDKHLYKVRVIFNAYYSLACPVNVPKNHRMTAVKWAIDQLSGYEHGHFPLKAEDLYKLKSDVEYFFHRRKDISAEGLSHDIKDYDYGGLLDLLKPYRFEQERKAMQRMQYKVTDEKQAKIMSETSILYNGPEGLVVVPHSVEASNYWGAHTRWCISARNNNKFKSYNADGPIVIYLPQLTARENNDSDYLSHKFALVEGRFHDEQDSTYFERDAYLERLTQAFRNTIHPSLKDYRAILTNDVIPEETKKADSKPLNPQLTDEQRNDYKVAHELIQENGLYFYYLSPKLRANKDLAILAMQTHHGEVWEWISDRDLQYDQEILAEAFKNGFTIIHNQVDQDSNFYKSAVEGAVRYDPSIMGSMPVELYHDDLDFVKSIFQANHKIFPHLSVFVKAQGQVVADLLEHHPGGIMSVYEECGAEALKAFVDIEDIEKRALRLTLKKKWDKDMFLALHRFHILQAGENFKRFLNNPQQWLLEHDISSNKPDIDAKPLEQVEDRYLAPKEIFRMS